MGVSSDPVGLSGCTLKAHEHVECIAGKSHNYQLATGTTTGPVEPQMFAIARGSAWVPL
jgi:hypothetical protein